jgi:hypothetical protein
VQQLDAQTSTRSVLFFLTQIDDAYCATTMALLVGVTLTLLLWNLLLLLRTVLHQRPPRPGQPNQYHPLPRRDALDGCCRQSFAPPSTTTGTIGRC